MQLRNAEARTGRYNASLVRALNEGEDEHAKNNRGRRGRGAKRGGTGKEKGSGTGPAEDRIVAAPRGRGRGNRRGAPARGEGAPFTEESEAAARERREVLRLQRLRRNEEEQQQWDVYLANQAATRSQNPEDQITISVEPSRPLAAPATPTLSRHANRIVRSLHFNQTPDPIHRIALVTRVARSPLSANRPSAGVRVKPRNDNALDVWEFFDRGSVQKGIPTVCSLCK
ncbi:MAG TPA: hypothetical protein VGO47_03880 [Chlamydiales bacterium]|nr:hypothetical protein [Chlamydiales bacterium]